jgi:type I restriction enzyme R subunit
MLRIFDERVKGMIGGRAKAMIVTSSRVAGLRYFGVAPDGAFQRIAGA